MTELSRRDAIAAGLAAAALPSVARAQAQPDPFAVRNSAPPLPDTLHASSIGPIGVPKGDEFDAHGNKPATRAQQHIADQILDRVPHGSHPLVIAHYFSAIAWGYGDNRGVEDIEGRPLTKAHLSSYVREWSIEQWNPVLRAFFDDTRLDPDLAKGDHTHWCAAFVSYCGQSSGVDRFQPYALAQHHRGNGREIDFEGGEEMLPGDLLIWRRPVAVEDNWAGHVAFLDGRFPVKFSPSEDLLALGGNQVDHDPSRPDGTGSETVCTRGLGHVLRPDRPAKRKELFAVRRLVEERASTREIKAQYQVG